MLSCVQLYDPIPSRLLCRWGFSSKNTRVGCHFLLQGNLPDPGIKPVSPVSPALQADSSPTEPPRKLYVYFMNTYVYHVTLSVNKVSVIT